jgi:nitrate/nitrite-specific signal transduction histidine kinase
MLELEVEDHGVGFSGRPARQGIGLVAMRERSELMGGRIVFSIPAAGGTLVHLTVPREKVESRDKDQTDKDQVNKDRVNEDQS